jgi:diguanylate cyclase (GGDEF)-like protein
VYEQPASEPLSGNCQGLFQAVGDSLGAPTACGVWWPELDLGKLEDRATPPGDVLAKLKASRDVIRQHNEQLRTAATHDALTSCYNRRALFEELERQLEASRESGQPLACVLADIDHFRVVNDTHGHAVGDEVLQMVGGVLRSGVGEQGFVGRYAGDQFCVVLPIDRGLALHEAEQLRRKIAAAPCAAVRVTASFGVTDAEMGPSGPWELLRQSEQALHGAKRRGRNCVLLWDTVRDETPAQTTAREPAGRTSEISAACVSGLLTSLGYRHPPTVDHARRVADLCLAAGRGLLREQDCDMLEVAALLHDVGLLGVPDAILFKRGPLTQQEWKVLRTHQRIGQEIVATVFGSVELAQLVRGRGCWFDGSRGEPGAPVGKEIPLGARILAIAEAFDAMIYDRAYRPARSRAQAFAELRRCAGTQFDPGLVERVIVAVEARDRAARRDQVSTAVQAAMRIGLHLEKLACALDAEDPATLSLLAGQLKDVAEHFRLDEVAASAGDLEQQAGQGADWPELVRLGAELSDLCRSVQESLIQSPATGAG